MVESVVRQLTLREDGYETDPNYAPIRMEMPEKSGEKHTILLRRGVAKSENGSFEWVKLKIEANGVENVQLWPDSRIINHEDEMLGLCNDAECPYEYLAWDGDFCPIGVFRDSVGIDSKLSKSCKGGSGVTVAVVDSGIQEDARVVNSGIQLKEKWPDYKEIKRVHGTNMAKVIGLLAPECSLIDLNIFKGTKTKSGIDYSCLISNAIAAYDYLLANSRPGKRPIVDIVNNSWGLYSPCDCEDLAFNEGHPFVGRVKEAINKGMVIVFSSGNCGKEGVVTRGYKVSPDCETFQGPGQSIWGANGLREVITVGAVMPKVDGPDCYHFFGYSSAGPSLFCNGSIKPDICGPSGVMIGTHQEHQCNGTSTAAAAVTGVLAMLRNTPEMRKMWNQSTIRKCLISTATPIQKVTCANNWAGYGFVNARGVFDCLRKSDSDASLSGRTPGDAGFG